MSLPPCLFVLFPITNTLFVRATITSFLVLSFIPSSFKKHDHGSFPARQAPKSARSVGSSAAALRPI
jgi:hypothetical protein